MAKPIQNPTEDEPSALPFRTGGRLRRKTEYVIFYFLAISSWIMEIAAACLGSLYGAQSHYFIATITPFLPTALIGMVTWAVAYRFRDKASSQAYWIIFLVVWILNIVVCIMNVYNNISWESDLLYQIAPDVPQGNFWLAVLGIRSAIRAKDVLHENTKDAEFEMKQRGNKQRV
ncbi:hypothetical protein H2200_008200 [Cladophialophora chaetospira]|uniref:Uncharacterized protein n=1 Tax=Cladophialophora chaetospira TaxID=386627 RepID=A0AA38X5B2_9EURO|nr:hypothetical protein H2200_008200 [Cladophialophora chaetospira]